MRATDKGSLITGRLPSIPMMEQPKFKIVIEHNGLDYVASVSGIPGCVALGWSYAAALSNVERLLNIHLSQRLAATKKIVNRASEAPAVECPSKLAAIDVLQYLERKFGPHTNKEYAALLKLDCDHVEFDNALRGAGKRHVRVQIALAIGILPSAIWTERSLTMRREDDLLYAKKYKQNDQ